MVNKGWIHGYLRDFQGISSNSIKSRWEIRDFSNYRSRTPTQIHLIKNHLIWIKICKEIKEQNSDKNSIVKRDKTDK